MEEYEIHKNHFTKGQPYILLYEVILTNQRFNWHDSVEILYFKKGSAKLTLNSEVLYAQPGDVVVINSNTVHNIISADNTIIEFYCLIVSSDFLASYSLYFTDKTLFQTFVTSPDTQELCEKITQAFMCDDPFSRATATANIMLLFVQLQKHFLISNIIEIQPGLRKNKILMIQNALEYIKSNYLNKISVQDIADYVNFNSDYLSHTFKECTGHTIVYYINLLRCHHARMLLSQHDISVSAAATESGFYNISYFTKKYKEIFGTLPSSSKR